MKNISAKIKGFTVVLLAVTALGCKPGRRVVIKSDDGSHHQKTEYSGQVVFTADKKGIEHISDGGYLLFERDDEKFEAHPEQNGHIKYSFNGDEVDDLTPSQQAFVRDAAAIITKERVPVNASRNQ